MGHYFSVPASFLNEPVSRKLASKTKVSVKMGAGVCSMTFGMLPDAVDAFTGLSSTADGRGVSKASWHHLRKHYLLLLKLTQKIPFHRVGFSF